MKKLFILAPFVIGAALYVGLTSNSAGPGVAPLVGGNGCSSAGTCHGSGLTASVGVNIQVLSGATPVTAYTPGTAYTIRVTGTNGSASSLPKFGLQAAAVTSASATAGLMAAPVGTHTFSASGITVLEHSSPLAVTTGTGGSGSTYVVNIPWTAPVAGTGAVSIYSMVNLVNGTGTSAGDQWDSTSFSIPEATAAAAIAGTLTVCAGATTTLNGTPAGGTWLSGTPGVATVSASGVVNGVAAGTSNITYTVGTATTSATVTVNAAPTAITGTASSCLPGTTTLASTPAGGTWTSGTTTVATVATSGVVTAVAVGTSTISYTVAGCRATKIMTVNANGAAPIAGSHSVCVTTTTTLTNLTPGGTWTSSTPAKATVGASTGIVTGVAVGTTTISYTATNTCGTGTATYTMNVLAAGSCASGVSLVTGYEGNTLKVYPNPNNGNFTLNMLSENAEAVHVVIYNLAGMKVKELFTLTNAATEIALPEVRGTYFVMAVTDHGKYTANIAVQ